MELFPPEGLPRSGFQLVWAAPAPYRVIESVKVLRGNVYMDALRMALLLSVEVVPKKAFAWVVFFFTVVLLPVAQYVSYARPGVTSSGTHVRLPHLVTLCSVIH